MAKKKKLNKSTTQENTKTFRLQVKCNNLSCKRKCAERVDALAQKEIFEKYHSLNSWSAKVLFLRSIAMREMVKENLSARVNLKNRNFYSSYFLDDSNGEIQRVCSAFLIALLQINRTKLFRSLSSIKKNPNAIDHRGKNPKKKTNAADISFLSEFLKTLPQYESKINPKLSPVKYFHPNLTVPTVYQLYVNICAFKQRIALTRLIFDRVMRGEFPNLKPYKSSTNCRQCEHLKEQKQRQVLSVMQRDKIDKEEESHITDVKAIKNELLMSIDPELESTEVLVFELQQPLEMPSVSVDESYDRRPLWFSNLCIYDEKQKRAFMYVWDETIAERGPEQIASCLFRHIYNEIPKTASNIIIYSKSSSLYRNMKISLMLKKICDYRNNSTLVSIEQKFFIKGHDSNDCNKCFEAIDKQIKNYQSKEKYLYTPNDWMDLISSAKQSEPRFTLINMTTNDFYSVAHLMKFVISEKHSSSGEEILWPKISNITYTLNEPFKLSVCYADKEATVHLLSNQDNDEFRKTKLIYSNKGGNAISKAKFDKLQKYLEYIPIAEQEYFKSIKFKESDSDQDFVLASYSSDEDSNES